MPANDTPQCTTLSSECEVARLSSKGYRAALCAVVVITFLVFLFNLGGYRTLGSHEVFAAVPAREMVMTGDWIVPRFGGSYRFEKPPLNYWMIATVGVVTGNFSEWTVRLPSAVSSILLVALMGCWATRWYGREAGLAAALIQATSIYMIEYGRQGIVDMPQALLIVAALFLIANFVYDERPRSRLCLWVGVSILLSLTWLAKFHFGPAMIGFPTLVFLLLERRLDRLRVLLNPIGIAIFALAVSAWPALVYVNAPEAWEVWNRETFGRVAGQLYDESMPWFYLHEILLQGLPWIPFLAIAAKPSWRAAYCGNNSRERFLWVWLLTQSTILTLVVTRHTNYLVATMPVFTLLLCRPVAEWFRKLGVAENRPKSFSPLLLATAAVSGSLVLWYAVAHKYPHLSLAAQLVALLFAISSCITLALLTLRQGSTAITVSAVSLMGIYLLVEGWILPGTDHRSVAAVFADDIRTNILPEESIGVYHMHLAHGGLDPLVYQLGSPVYRCESAPLLKNRLREKGRLYLVAYEALEWDLSQWGDMKVLRRMPMEVNGMRVRRPPTMLVRLDERNPALPTSPAKGPSIAISETIEASTHSRQ